MSCELFSLKVTDEWAVYHLSGSFFVTFLDKQKSKEAALVTLLKKAT